MENERKNNRSYSESEIILNSLESDTILNTKKEIIIKKEIKKYKIIKEQIKDSSKLSFKEDYDSNNNDFDENDYKFDENDIENSIRQILNKIKIFFKKVDWQDRRKKISNFIKDNKQIKESCKRQYQSINQQLKILILCLESFKDKNNQPLIIDILFSSENKKIQNSTKTTEEKGKIIYDQIKAIDYRIQKINKGLNDIINNLTIINNSIIKEQNKQYFKKNKILIKVFGHIEVLKMQLEKMGLSKFKEKKESQLFLKKEKKNKYESTLVVTWRSNSNCVQVVPFLQLYKNIQSSQRKITNPLSSQLHSKFIQNSEQSQNYQYLNNQGFYVVQQFQPYFIQSTMPLQNQQYHCLQSQPLYQNIQSSQRKITNPLSSQLHSKFIQNPEQSQNYQYLNNQGFYVVQQFQPYFIQSTMPSQNQQYHYLQSQPLYQNVQLFQRKITNPLSSKLYSQS